MRHGNRGGQDLGVVPRCSASSAGAATRWPPASRPSRSTSTPRAHASGARPTPSVLGAASGEPPDYVCPTWRSYHLAMAPPMAAEALGLPAFTVADLVDELAWPDEQVTLGLVETAGGVRSPQAADGDTVDLVAALDPDVVVLVADAGLGTINAVRLSLAALGAVTRADA